MQEDNKTVIKRK